MDNLLALDLGTEVGVAVGPPDGVVQTFTYAMPKGVADGRFWRHFGGLFKELMETHNPAFVAYESVYFSQQSINAGRKLHGQEVVLQMGCDLREIPTGHVTAMGWKKVFTGNGRAEPDLIMRTCRAWRLTDPQSIHEACATGVWFHTCSIKASGTWTKRFPLGALGSAVPAA